MSLLNAERIVHDILRLVDAQDQATFAELDRTCPAPRAPETGRPPAHLQ